VREGRKGREGRGEREEEREKGREGRGEREGRDSRDFQGYSCIKSNLRQLISTIHRLFPVHRYTCHTGENWS